MILCTWKQLSEARTLVTRGYQVLYLNPVKHNVNDKVMYGHLMDLNRTRLVETAEKLGIKSAKVHGDEMNQRIVLTGQPLRKALAQSDQSWTSWFNTNQVTA